VKVLIAFQVHTLDHTVRCQNCCSQAEVQALELSYQVVEVHMNLCLCHSSQVAVGRLRIHLVARKTLLLADSHLLVRRTLWEPARSRPSLLSIPSMQKTRRWYGAAKACSYPVV